MNRSEVLSSLALRSPVKSHSAARTAGTAIALSPGLRSICLQLTWSARSNARHERHLAARRAGARNARPRGIAGCGRLEGHGSRVIETASSETDCTRDSAPTGLKSESRVSAKARNPANEMRFPVSRQDGGNASALSPVRGGRRRLFLARSAQRIGDNISSHKTITRLIDVIK